MLKKFLKDSRTLLRLREEPLGPFLDSFAKDLSDKGYSWQSARVHIQLAGGFSRWLKLNNIVAQSITFEHIPKYIKYRKTHQQRIEGTGITIALKRVLEIVQRDSGSVQKVSYETPAPADSLVTIGS